MADKRTFPTLGNPTNPTEAIPVRATSKPGPIHESTADVKGVHPPSPPPPPPPPEGLINSLRSLASLAFNWPKW
jgi:hypothetical protein